MEEHCCSQIDLIKPNTWTPKNYAHAADNCFGDSTTHKCCLIPVLHCPWLAYNGWQIDSRLDGGGEAERHLLVGAAKRVVLQVTTDWWMPGLIFVAAARRRVPPICLDCECPLVGCCISVGLGLCWSVLACGTACLVVPVGGCHFVFLPLSGWELICQLYRLATDSGILWNLLHVYDFFSVLVLGLMIRSASFPFIWRALPTRNNN